MKTIQIQRSRPSSLALLLALLLTLLFVYAALAPALSLYGGGSDAASARSPLSTTLRMEGLETHFTCHSRCSDPLQTRIHAAQCIAEGGAGLILSDGSGYAVLCGTADAASNAALSRSAPGLTLRLQGSAAELAAVADGVSFLRAQAMETGLLASALENGETDAASVRALLGVYRTQGKRVQSALEILPEQRASAAILAAVTADLSRLSDSAATPSGLRLLHAAACAEWIGLLEALAAAA